MSVRTKPAPDPEKNGFIQGVAYAAAFLIRYHDRPTVALELLKEAGFSKADLLKARVDEYDLEPIKTAAHGERGVKHAWKWR